jgi:hypothetical protein
LDAVRCVVVLWSRDSVTSEWVRIEAYEGQRRGILIPALLDDVTESIPLAFSLTQAASLVAWSGNAAGHSGFEELARAVERVILASATSWRHYHRAQDAFACVGTRAGAVEEVGFSVWLVCWEDPAQIRTPLENVMKGQPVLVFIAPSPVPSTHHSEPLRP